MFEDKVEVINDLSFIESKLKWFLFVKTVKKNVDTQFCYQFDNRPSGELS